MESISRNEATVAKIQRLEDAKVNPLTNKEWPKGHEEMVQGRRKLPVYGSFEEILDVYHKHQVFVLSSETGSGKSTQIPQMLVYDEYASELQIACTQPRRLATTSLARRVSEEMGVVLGEEVGYQIGGDKRVNKNQKKTRLAYMTEGVLVRKLTTDKNLSEFACIIIDEAHERTEQTDYLLAMLKKAVSRRKDLKVIIMSATVNAKLFQDYFNNCPLVQIAGRNFKVDIRYLEEDSEDLSHSDFRLLIASRVMEIHETKAPGDILVFVPGQGEIAQVCGFIRMCTESIDVFPLYSALSPSAQKRALQSSGTNRKCIVCTNIAETSLTIDTIVFVIDTGLSRKMLYNPRLDMNMLVCSAISQASAKQRTGRAGRTRDGVCYRLYTKADFDAMAASTMPAILSGPVHSTVLKLASAGFVKVLDFDWIDKPHPESVARAAQDLIDWGFLQNNGIATKEGAFADACPLDPVWVQALYQAVKFDCAHIMLDIAVVSCGQRSIFLHSPQHRPIAETVRGQFARHKSDHIGLSNAFDMYMRAREKHQANPDFSLALWCRAHMLNITALEEARILRETVGVFIAKKGTFSLTSVSNRDPMKVRKALALAFSHHAAISLNNGQDDFMTVPENAFVRAEPTSSVNLSGDEWVVYTSLNKSGRRIYMETVTVIDPKWLVGVRNFRDDRLPLKGDGTYRQPQVKESIDAARARIAASKAE